MVRRATTYKTCAVGYGTLYDDLTTRIHACDRCRAPDAGERDGSNGKTVWYILTDVSHVAQAKTRVLSFMPLPADGFAAGKHVFYISTEASDPGAATLERATYTPAIGASPTSARLRIVVIVNGQARELAYAALHGNLRVAATTATSASLNILGGLPAVTPDGGIYDPLWNVEVDAWSAAAVAAKKNIQLTSVDAVTSAVDAKLLTGPGGKPFGPAGFAVN